MEGIGRGIAEIIGFLIILGILAGGLVVGLVWGFVSWVNASDTIETKHFIYPTNIEVIHKENTSDTTYIYSLPLDNTKPPKVKTTTVE